MKAFNGRPVSGARTGGFRLLARRVSQLLSAAVLGFIIIYVFILMPLPYYIMKPGSAEEIRPMVAVARGGGTESGTFMLTTVSVYDSNLSAYLWAKLRHEEIQKKQNVRQQGESQTEYDQRQEFVMLTSQANAIQAAYHKLGIGFHIKRGGVMVLRTIAGMPAAQTLRPGDYIVKIDDREVGSREDLLQGLQGKKEGDSVFIEFSRNGQLQSAGVALAVFPDTEGQAERQSGIGIVTGDVQSVEADDPANHVTVQAGDIGGPSAGLMFSLEIYNQLSGGDITKGYRIAGTGEISPEGTVGVIGGIQHKVAAANREKADIFFAPNDYTDSAGNRYTNATDAQKAAAEIGTAMKIVPVGTMQDALDYLASLPPKPSSPSKR